MTAVPNRQTAMNRVPKHNFITAFFLWLFVYFSINQYMAGQAKWIHSPLDVGDWLINYQGGFVRRGLAGEILFKFFSHAHHDVGLRVMEFEVLILILLAVAVTYLLLRVKNSWLPWIILSPVGVAFSAYDTPGGFRKENLLFLAMAVVAISTKTKPKYANWWLGLGFLLFGLVLFSWEPSAFSLPVFWWVISRTNLNKPLIRRWQLSFSALALFGLGLSSLFHGSQAQVVQICHSLVATHQTTLATCKGSIASLAGTPSDTLRFVASEFPRYWYYLLWYGLSLVPFLASGFFRNYWRICSAVLAGNFLLFVVGSDYGRWINIMFVSLAILWLVSPEVERDSKKQSVPLRIATVAWISLWTAPWSGNPLLWKGLAVSAYLNWSHPVGFYIPWFHPFRLW